MNEPPFPFPKMMQTFNYFFPQQEGKTDLFTMANLHKLARLAPYLTLGILVLVFSSWIRDCLHIRHSEPKFYPSKWGFYTLADTVLFIIIFFRYFWWLGVALFAKLLKRSPIIPLAMSFLEPLKLLGYLLFLHFLGFVVGGCMDMNLGPPK